MQTINEFHWSHVNNNIQMECEELLYGNCQSSSSHLCLVFHTMNFFTKIIRYSIFCYLELQVFSSLVLIKYYLLCSHLIYSKFYFFWFRLLSLKFISFGLDYCVESQKFRLCDLDARQHFILLLIFIFFLPLFNELYVPSA